MPLLDVVLGYDCNLACSYCTITDAMRLRAMPTERVAREIDRAALRGFRDVAFTGGEPTIRSDLPALVKHAKRRGFERVKVASNGLRYAHEAYLDHLISCGVTDFHVSMHALSDEAYEATVQRAETAALRRAAIANLTARGLDPMADLIVKEDTYRDLGAWILGLSEQGIRRFSLWLVSLTDKNRPNAAQLPKISDVAPRVKEALDLARTRGLLVWSLHIPRCFLSGYEEHVRHPGDELVTVVTPDEVFDLKNSKLAGGVKPEGCEGCRYFENCPGLRPDYIERFGGAEARAVIGDSKVRAQGSG